MILRSIIYIGTALLVLFFIITCSDDQKAKQEIIRPVKYKQVSLSTGTQTRTFSGISKAGTKASLSFKVGGTIQSLNVKVGDKVKKGKLIASIDDSDAKLKYDKVLASLRRAEIQMETAKSNLDRVKGMYENNNISLREYESAKERYTTARSGYEAEKKSENLQQRELSYYRLYAPMDGFIAAVFSEKNENVQPGQVITEINAGQDIEVTVGIPGAFISKVKTGETVSIKFMTISNDMYEGKVTEVSYAISSQSSIYPVTIEVTQPTEEIRPGMPVKVTFNFIAENKNEHLVVPANSVGEDSKGNFVFTVVETDKGFATVHKKPISVGQLTSEGFEILSGLQDGELVVIAGIAHLSDGMKVRLLK